MTDAPKDARTWPCGTPRIMNNAFTGVGLPEREQTRPLNCKRGPSIDVCPRPLNSIAEKSDPVVKRAKLLRGAMR